MPYESIGSLLIRSAFTGAYPRRINELANAPEPSNRRLGADVAYRSHRYSARSAAERGLLAQPVRRAVRFAGAR